MTLCICRECFLPNSELSKLQYFHAHINTVFPGGSLWLNCSDREFKRFFMDVTKSFLDTDNHRRIETACSIGRNIAKDGFDKWVFSPSVHLDGEGKLVDLKRSRFIWLQSTGESSINDTLACEMCTPLDEGECLSSMLPSKHSCQTMQLHVLLQWPVALWVLHMRK